MARFCVGANKIYEFYDTHHNLWVTAGFQVSTTSSTTSAPLPGDCADVLHLGETQSKVYKIFPRTLNQGIDVYCDMETDGGGWVILQRRADGSVDFDRDWHAYEYGFGHLLGDVWLGNSLIHAVSSQAQYEVRFDLTSFTMEKKYAVYDNFSVEGPDTNYTLHLSGYHGDVGDSLTKYPDSDINGMKFTTFDRDNDKYDYNCADLHHSGGWWYNDCTDALLNAPYQQHEQSSSLYRIYWHTWQRATRNALKRTEIKIRPRTKTR